MISQIIIFFDMLIATLRDITPILVIIFSYQLFVLRKQMPHLPQVIMGFIYVLLGLTFFLLGLENALFPLGKFMAEQLTDPNFLNINADGSGGHYFWLYIFAATIGFSTTIAEPSLIAVAIKANQVSGGNVSVWGLRIAVALGVAIGITLGSYRIVTGTPLHWYIITGYIIVIIQTIYCPKTIIALAYDSGGVTTSTVTVPLVAALGLGLATHIPGRDPLLDGFGLIAFASLLPIMSVMAYAQISEWYSTHPISQKED